MKKIITLIVMISIAMGVLVSINNKDAIIIYSSMEQFRNDELQRQLNERFPNEHVYVMYNSTAKTAAKLSVEKERSDADIVVGLESSYMEKIKDSLEDVSDLSTIPYLNDCLVPDHRYVTWERTGGSFIVNTDVLEKKGLPIPMTYEDLLNPEYRDLISMPDPKASSTGYFFYLNLVNELGEEKAIEYFDGLAKNIKSFTDSGSGPVKLLIQGEIGIGLGMTFQGITEMNNGHPFKVIQPNYGSPYTMSGTGLVKGRKDDEDIVEVYQFIINDFIKYDKENFNPGKIYEGQTSNLENYPKDIQFANMKNIESIQEKERLLSLWKY